MGTSSNNRPLQTIEIVDSGIVPLLKPFMVAKEASTIEGELNSSLTGSVVHPEDIDGNEYIDDDDDDDNEALVGEAKEL